MASPALTRSTRRHDHRCAQVLQPLRGRRCRDAHLEAYSIASTVRRLRPGAWPAHAQEPPHPVPGHRELWRGRAGVLDDGPRLAGGGRDERLRTGLRRSALPELLDRQGVLGAHLIEGERTASGTETAEKRLGSGGTQFVDWVILVAAMTARRWRRSAPRCSPKATSLREALGKPDLRHLPVRALRQQGGPPCGSAATSRIRCLTR